MNGTYLLMMELQHQTTIHVGKLGRISFNKGWYVYVGSALNGLDQRIKRHLRAEKKLHWHIDYLLPFTAIVGVYYKENNKKEECTIADLFKQNLTNIPGFGCSDCYCASHLFYGSCEEIINVVKTLPLKSYMVHPNP
jgi:Uri superfamily endonuclease